MFTLTDKGKATLQGYLQRNLKSFEAMGLDDAMARITQIDTGCSIKFNDGECVDAGIHNLNFYGDEVQEAMEKPKGKKAK